MQVTNTNDHQMKRNETNIETNIEKNYSPVPFHGMRGPLPHFPPSDFII